MKERKLVALDGNAEIHAVDGHVGHERHDDLFRQGAEFRLDFGDEGAQDRGRLLFDLETEAEVEALDNGAATDAQEIAERLGSICDKGKYIHVADRRAGDDGLAVVALERLHLALVDLGLLEIEIFRRCGHLATVVLDELASAAFEHRHDFFDISGIFGLGHPSDAASLATSDMHFEAGAVAVMEDSFAGNLQLACPQRIQVGEHLQKVAGMEHRAVGAEIPRTVLDNAPGQEHLRKIVGRNAYPRIGLRVLQQDVVARLVLLDQIVFQQEGVGFGLHHGILRVGDLADEDARLPVKARRVDEILGHPFVEVLGLADIDYRPVGIVITVHARRMRKQRYLLSYVHSSAKLGIFHQK